MKKVFMFSQKKYPNVMLGNSNTSISKAGCFITSYSNLLEYYGRGLTPPEVNEVGKKCGAFSGANLIAPKLSEALNLSYERVSEYNGGGVVIAETNHYKSQGFSQHFYLLDTSSGKMVDPLDENPIWRANKYNVVSYRIINNLNKMNKDFVSILEKITKLKLGDNINIEKEQPEVAKKLKEYREEKENLENDYESFKLKTKLNLETLETRIENQTDMLKAKDEQIEKLKSQTGDLASASFMQLLKEIKNRIVNY